MAKDPAFLFYPGDWLCGTMCMTFEEKGAYMELLMFQFNHGPFTEQKAKMVLRANPSLWEDVKLKFKLNDDGLYFNQRLKEEQSKRQNYTESRRQSRTKSDEDNVRIYIVRDNVRSTYKIGSSVNPVRRYNELANQKTPAIMADEQGSRDISLIWYSDPVERKEETKLHKQFLSKNLSGEWFALDEMDLKKIYSKYKGTMYRTSPRTENEIENVNEIINTNKSKLEIFEELFNDERYVEQLSMTHKGKSLNQAFEECYIHHSNAPNPPGTLGEWKQKLNTWLANTKLNGTSKNGKQTTRDLAAALQQRIMQDAIKQQPSGSS